jgi:outer membrane receptor protein involved in Fe transport
MRSCVLGLALAAMPCICPAQQPPAADSARVHTHGDSLTRRPVTLQAVTVTATPPQRDEPSGAARITASVIRQTPATNTYDLLRQAAGLEVHDQGQGPGFASDVSLRGFSSDHSTDVALWIDGVPVNEPVNGHAEGYNDWDVLMPQAVSEIDVLKGPTSALFGNFATAGVVNVRTLERMRGVRVAATGGAHGRLEGSLLTGVDGPTTGAVFGVRGLREDGWRPHSAYDIEQAHGRWVRRLAPNTTLDAGLELYGAGWDSPGFLADSLFRLRRYDVVENATDGGFKRRAQERLSLRVIAGPAMLWRSTVYAAQSRWQLYLTIPPEPGSGEGSGSQTEEEDTRHGFGATSAITWALPRGEITVGSEGRWDESAYENWFTTARHRDSSQALVSARQASGALFVQSAIDLGRHVRASLGGRYDVQDTRSVPVGGQAASHAQGVLSPKLGLLVHLPVFGAVYGNMSRGFRSTDGVIADPTLPLITAWAYEVGAKVDRGRVSASAALFRMDVSNEQTFDPITLTSTSGGASRRQGLELELVARLDASVTFSTDWTFNDARYRRLITATDTLDGARVFNTARYVGVVALALAPPAAHWHARVSANVVGLYTPFDSPGVELPAYRLLHVSAGVRLGRRGTLEFGVRNVLDHAYPELRAGSFVSPGQPRSLFVSVQLES